jgi:undecaprenyl pyrophosphate phosphatase UppP
MIRFNREEVLKKWIPLVTIASAVVIVIGLIFKSSATQIISSIIVSIVLILSGLLFRAMGRDKNQGEGKKFDEENKIV